MTNLLKQSLSRVLIILVALLLSLGAAFSTTGCIRAVEDLTSEEAAEAQAPVEGDKDSDSQNDSNDKKQNDEDSEDEGED